MKRASLPAAVLLLLAAATATAADTAPGDEIRSWLDGVRRTASPGSPSLAVDPILARTARSYAAILAALGRISHTGPDGSDALTRYLAEGGTCAHVAEIIGAGPGLAEIRRAWMESPSHREAVLRSSWTDVGWGMARTAAGEIWVVLFARRLATELSVEHAGDGTWKVGGVLHAADAQRPVLLSGTARVEPAAWTPATGRFAFRGPADEWSGYVRLGYITSAGVLVITDVLTSPRGTGSRQDGSRS